MTVSKISTLPAREKAAAALEQRVRAASRREIGARFAAAGSYHEARRGLIDAFERRYVDWVLRETGGNVSAAARIADCDRTTLNRLMRKHELEREAYRSESGESEGSGSND